MNIKSIVTERDPETQVSEAFQKNRRWFLALGIAMLFLGFFAMSMPVVTTLAMELFLGWLLVAGGIGQTIHAFLTRQWRGFFFELLTGMLYISIGILLLSYPFSGVLTLTLVLAIFLLFEGFIKVIMAFRLRSLGNWGWLFFSGVTALIVGILIWRHWPSDAAYVIGLFIGIDLFFSGLSMVMISMASRRSALMKTTHKIDCRLHPQLC